MTIHTNLGWLIGFPLTHQNKKGGSKMARLPCLKREGRAEVLAILQSNPEGLPPATIRSQLTELYPSLGSPKPETVGAWVQDLILNNYVRVKPRFDRKDNIYLAGGSGIENLIRGRIDA
jgi:hypothetical protein